jgi:hypothetical protein
LVENCSVRNDGVLSELTHLKNGSIEDALAKCAEEFCFTDRALRLEFTDKVQRFAMNSKSAEPLRPECRFRPKIDRFLRC